MNSKFTVAAVLANIVACQSCIPNPAVGDCGYDKSVWELALELSDVRYIEFKESCQ